MWCAAVSGLGFAASSGQVWGCATSGYVEELRAAVGPRPLILPGAALLIVDGRRRLLMLRRGDSGRWGIPGGFMEPGETIEETARRELLEETGLRVGALALYRVLSGPGAFHAYPNGDQVHNVTVVFTGSAAGGRPQPDGRESTEAAFMPLDALPSPLSPPIADLVVDFAARSRSGQA